MEFIDFFPYVPSKDWFAIPKQCFNDFNASAPTLSPRNPFPNDRTDLSGLVSKPVTGVISTFTALGGLLIGGVIGYAFSYFVHVKKLGQSKSTNFHQTNI
jgi:hypothetical protein